MSTALVPPKGTWEPRATAAARAAAPLVPLAGARGETGAMRPVSGSTPPPALEGEDESSQMLIRSGNITASRFS